MSFDTPRYPSVQDHSLFDETPASHDTFHVDPAGIDAFGSEVPDPAAVPVATVGAAAEPGVPSWPARVRIRAFAALALLEALIVAGLLFGRPGSVDTRDGRLVIESEPAGAEVWLDGQHLGTTPLSLTSTAGERSLRIEALGASRTMKLDVANGQVTHARVDFVKVSTAAVSTVPAPSAVPVPTASSVPPSSVVPPPSAPRPSSVTPPSSVPQPPPAPTRSPAPQQPAPEATSAPLDTAAVERVVEPGWIELPTVVALDVSAGRRHAAMRPPDS